MPVPPIANWGSRSDSPRGRIYQMAQVANGAPITPSYVQHIDLCLACRGCETACPSGVPYGRMVEGARAQIEAQRERKPAARRVREFVFGRLLQSPRADVDRGYGALSLRSERIETRGARHGFHRHAGEAGRAHPACALGRAAVLLQPHWRGPSRTRRTAISRGVSGRLHRQRRLCAIERGDGARAAQERLPRLDSGRTGMLRRAPPAFRAARGRGETCAA